MNELDRRVKADWKPLSRISIVSHTFRSLVLLGGSLIVSRLLENALEGKLKDSFSTFLFGLGFSVVAFILDYLLSKARNRSYIMTQDRWRGDFSEMVVSDNLKVESSGAYDGRAEDDTWYLAQWAGNAFPDIIGCSLSMTIAFMPIIYHDWLLALILLLVSFISFIPKLVYEKWAKKNYDEEQSASEDYTDWIEEGVSGARTIKAYGVESWFIDRFRKSNQIVLKRGVKAEGTSTVEDMVSTLVTSIFDWGTYLIIGAFALFGRIEIAILPLMVVMGQHMLTNAFNLTDSLIYRFLSDEAIERLGKWHAKEDVSSELEMEASLEGIRKSFGGKEVLKGVSLDFSKGSRTKLVGENGSGKTTLMRILIGMDKPDSGKVERSRSEIAFSFQDDPVIPASARYLVDKVLLTGESNEGELRRLLDLFKLSPILDRPVGDMSEGERKKLYVALTLSKKADFLILDEPTNHVDRESVEVLVEELRKRHETILICTHDERLESIGFDRTLVLEEGVING